LDGWKGGVGGSGRGSYVVAGHGGVDSARVGPPGVVALVGEPGGKGAVEDLWMREA